MIAYSLHVPSSKSAQSHDLVVTCREGGLVNSLIRQLPGCMNLSVLVSTESEILVIVFFTSLEDAVEATGSPMGVFLFGMLERMASRCRILGLYTFPVISETSDMHSANQVSASFLN